MSQDLKNRLERWVDRGEPTGALALLERVERDLVGLQAPPEVGYLRDTLPRPRWATAVASAVVVLTLIGGVALSMLLVASNDEVIDETPSSTITSTSTVPQSSTTLPPPSILGEWTTFRQGEELPEGRPTLMAVASDGSVWVHASEGLLSEFDGDTWTTYGPFVFETPSGSEYSALRSIYGRGDLGNSFGVSEDGQVWVVGGYGDGSGSVLAHFDGETWELHDLSSLPVRGFELAPDDIVWLPTENGVAQFEGEALHHWAFTESRTAGCCGLDWVTVAPDGTVWAQGDEGVSRFNGDDWTHYTPEDGLASPHAHHPVQFALDGTVWASGRGGVSSFDGATWTAWNDADGLLSVADLQIVLAPDGTPWALPQVDGGDQTDAARGMFRFDGARWHKVAEPPTPVRAWDFEFDLYGVAWGVSDEFVGSETPSLRRLTLVSFEGDSWTIHQPGVGDINGKRVAPDGTVWAYGSRGLAAYDGQAWRSYSTADGLPVGNVTQVMFEPDESLWINTGSAVLRLAPGN